MYAVQERHGAFRYWCETEPKWVNHHNNATVMSRKDALTLVYRLRLDGYNVGITYW